MPNSYRIRTEVGTNKTIQVNLDQDFDKLEILSMSIFPNDVYTRSCADFGVVCGRVFANKGLGLVNARVSIFIPISEEDESNPIISTLYPYKSFEDFNEDGYKYNLLPYSQSYSGHVPVGTFPDRLDALTNPSVIEVYDKYYKFTAKTNDAGDFMIFGIPIGQYQIFMQVDLSDIGEFSLAPQDLIRMGIATESQVNGTKFKFSENYSELPQIVTLTKTIQVAPFYGEEGVCQHYIVRSDFDLTTESSIELKPTAVFIGSLVSTENKVKLKDNCKVPKKLGNLCNLTAGPGQIECIRQTIFTDNDGRPILEEHRLENDGKLIDENGAWLVELPMNLDFQYTDEFGQRRISYDGSVGVPTRSRYRLKIKWQQSTSVAEENKRGYFLVPNIKEYGWINTNIPGDDPVYIDPNIQYLTFSATTQPPEYQIISSTDSLVNEYWRITDLVNISAYEVIVDGIPRPEFQSLIPLNELVGSDVVIRYELTDAAAGDGFFYFDNFSVERFSLQSSYAFSLNWYDYGTPNMVQEAIDCEDRFYEFIYNKVYTVSQFLDRFSFEQAPARTLQIKNILDNSCESENYPFPTNDVIYRTDVLYTIISIFLAVFKFILIALVPLIHMLAFLWPILAIIIGFVFIIYNLVVWVCNLFNGDNCPQKLDLKVLFEENPFKNIRLPLVLYTEDGCETCRCNTGGVDLDDSIANQIAAFAQQIDQVNISNLADFNVASFYDGVESQNFPPLQTMLTGSYTASNPWWNRLPMIAVSSTGGRSHRWSQSLTLAERLNLFNTKAKYFNNTNDLLSPGNKGWNQIKVTWKPGVNDPATKFHFDNVMIIIIDPTADINEGDMLTFRDPSLSLDPNVNSTNGINSLPTNVTVRYANPNYSVGGFLTTNYTIADSSKEGASTNCYPMDIEYFQVLKIYRPADFRKVRTDAFAAGHGNGLNFVGDNRYSFPYRFFPVNDITGYGVDYPFVNAPNGDVFYNDFQRVGRTFLTNSLRVNYMNVIATGRPDDRFDEENIGGLSGAANLFINPDGSNNWAAREEIRDTQCGNSTPHQELGIDICSSSKLNADPAKIDETVKVLVLQRGVDPNSPKIEMEIDFSRIFGMDYNNSIYGSGANLSGLDNNPYAKWRGLYRMNIPIQAGGDATGAGENWVTDNKTGLFLPRHNEITSNISNFSSTWSNVHFKSYVYTYDAGEYNGAWSSDSLKFYSALQSDTYSNTNWSEGLPQTAVQYAMGLQYLPLPIATVNRGFNKCSETLIQDSNYPNDTDYYRFLIRSTCEESGAFNSCCKVDGWGCGNYATAMYSCTVALSVWRDNFTIPNIGGYMGYEYVEGGSLFGIKTDLVTPNCSVDGIHANCDECDGRDEWTEIDLLGDKCGAQNLFFDSCQNAAFQPGNRRLIPEGSAYISPTYATFKNPDADAYTTSCNCTYSNRINIVMRTDRLPTSDTVQRNNKGNGYQLHQNAGFSMYLFSAVCENLAFGGGEITLPQVGSEDVNNEGLPTEFQNVANSLTSCSEAVDLNSYLVDDNPASPTYGVPSIGVEDPYSRTDADLGKDYVWFLRGSGCYNLVSKPIASLIGKTINEGTPNQRKYSDIRTIVEWVQRLKLNFALCFNVLSHTFSNNWINGTLFAFPFKNTTYFDTNNDPYRVFCRRNIYFNEILKSYFYRSSPYDGSNSNFVGRPSSNQNGSGTVRGNVKNLLYPTTILDMGPKNQFIQELVYSDDYDGYIVDKIPSTTFKDVTDIINLFVLSRIVNVKFIDMLIPTTLFEKGNEGGNDPSIGAFFANLRWNNGVPYRNYLLPGLIDADYAQTISVQSQYGVYEYSTETYGPTGIFFGRYDLTTERLNPDTGAIETVTVPGGGPVFGLYFSANTQNIDYISPRRQIFNIDAVTPPNYFSDFLSIPTFSQVIPFYQWNMGYTNSNTIFGYQSNNNVTDGIGGTGVFPNGRYQEFDRASTASQYFAPDGNLIRNYLSYPINFVLTSDTSGNTGYTPTQVLPTTTVNPITLGTPYYFYFGLKVGASAMDKFITKYVDTTIIND